MMGHDVQLCYLCLLIHKLRTSSKGNICIVKMKEWRGMKRLLFPYTQIMSNIECVESVKRQIKAKRAEKTRNEGGVSISKCVSHIPFHPSKHLRT